MKPIKLTEAAKQDALLRFKGLVETYTGDGDLTFKITTDSLITDADKIVKPTVYVTPEAFLQMQLLVSKSSEELAWHGTVERNGDNYIIKRIYVYPQTVTSTTVDADEEAYAQWIMELDDDVLNNLRFQGHSHVKMGVSPSGRDTGNWQKFLNLLTKDDFYIFCIANKQGEFYWNVFDMGKNIVFENKDVTMCVIDETGDSLVKWSEAMIDLYIKKPIRTNIISPGNSVYAQQMHMAESPCHYTPTHADSRMHTLAAKKYNSHAFAEFVPAALKGTPVCYEPEFDLYYSDTYVKGFVYSNTWGCFIMEGEDLRELYPSTKDPKEKKKKGPGRPKKGGN